VIDEPLDETSMVIAEPSINVAAVALNNPKMWVKFISLGKLAASVIAHDSEETSQQSFTLSKVKALNDIPDEQHFIMVNKLLNENNSFGNEYMEQDQQSRKIDNEHRVFGSVLI
jgi:hypothetical protein